MKFENSNFLWVFLTVAIITAALFYWVYFRRKQIIEKQFGTEVFKRLMPTWNGKFWPKNTLYFITGLSLIAFSLANPQWGNQSSKVSAKGVDLYIALDISNSMLANDVSPDRLEKAKKSLSELVDNLTGYRIGLIYFAGGAYLQMPLSADLSVAKLLLKSANPNQAGNQGTAIAEAIDMAISTFEKDNQNSRAILIVTDGETHDEASITSAEKAKSMGITVYALGVGTEKGGPIPYGNGFKLDENAQPVNTALNKDLVRNLAESGGGKAYFLDNQNFGLSDLVSDINKTSQEIKTTETYTIKGSYFQIPLGVGLVLCLFGFLWPFNQKRNDEVI
ncbi:MAG: VWA domain-containing protein [Saprospiraceae bacterium]|nr:VWA domain-containing protein [Saprospiraceae bacterium]